MLDLDKMLAQRRSTTERKQPADEGCHPVGAEVVGGACPGIAGAAAGIGLDRITLE